MIAVVVILMVLILCLAVSYRVLLARLRRLENELGETIDVTERIGCAVNDQSEALKYVDDYIKTSAQCILNIASELQKVIGKTAWMDGIDESLGKSINIDKYNKDEFSV